MVTVIESKMIKKQAARLVLVVASACPTLSSALSLGDIQFNSHVNEPFKARIELLQASEQELIKLQVHVAPPSLFAQAQLARPSFVDSLKFARLIKNGKNYLLISSSQVIAEPEFNLLLEVTSPKGNLLKRYSISLAEAPSNLAEKKVEQPKPIQERAELEPLTNTPIEALAPPIVVDRRLEPESRVITSSPQKQQPSNPVKSLAPKVAIALPKLAFKHRYRVRKTDTVFSIAERLKIGELNLDEKVLALYAHNPKAFVKGDLNQLKLGAVLKTPSALDRRHLAEPVQSSNRAESAKPSIQQKVVKAQALGTEVAKTSLNLDPSLEPILQKHELVSQLSLTDLQERLTQTQHLLVARSQENLELKELLQKKNRLLSRREDALAAALHTQIAEEQKPVQTAQRGGVAGPEGVRAALVEAAKPAPHLDNTWQGVFTSPLVWKMSTLSLFFLLLIALWQKRRAADQLLQLTVQNAMLLPDDYVDEVDETGYLDFWWAEDELAFAHEQLQNLRQSMANLREKSQRLQSYLQPESLSVV